MSNPKYIAIIARDKNDKKKKTCKVYLHNRLRNPIFMSQSYSRENVFAFSDRIEGRIKARLPHGSELLWEFQTSAL